jgi:hypothetical protein
MQARVAAILTLLFLAFCPALLAGGKPDAKFSATFHMEADGNDHPKMVFSQLANGKQRIFRRMPEISTKDIVSFSPFPSEVGDGYGVIFRLSPTATNRFASISAVNLNRWMIALVNGRVVDGVFIDKQINDGVLVIWKGLTLQDTELMDQSIPRIGEEGKKKKKK